MTSESSDIIEYLEKQYPSSPRVITPGTLAFEITYYKYFLNGIRPKWPKLVNTYLYETISPESAAFIKPLREEVFGDTLENIGKNPELQWDTLRGAYSAVALPIYEKAEGIFLKGSEPGWADFVTASFFVWAKLLFGADSKEWRFVETWDNGRWAKLVKDLEPYAYIDE